MLTADFAHELRLRRSLYGFSWKNSEGLLDFGRNDKTGSRQEEASEVREVSMKSDEKNKILGKY
jgi:hypothetical protein